MDDHDNLAKELLENHAITYDKVRDAIVFLYLCPIKEADEFDCLLLEMLIHTNDSSNEVGAGYYSVSIIKQIGIDLESVSYMS